MKRLLAILALPVTAMSQPYIGVGAGYGVTHDGKPLRIDTPVLQEHQTVRSSNGTVYGGWRFGPVALEVGAFTLPKQKGWSHSPDYPTYKNKPPGSYPQSVEIFQTIEGHSKYARANWYLPGLSFAEPYVFTGMAQTTTVNHEWGAYNGVDPVDYRAKYFTQRAMFGFGVEYGVGPIKGRIEFVNVNRASDEYHVRRRDVRFITAGLLLRF